MKSRPEQGEERFKSYKSYLGDGVYAEWDEATYTVVLTTENGLSVTNRIVLVPEVLDHLNSWIKLTLIRRTQTRREQKEK